MKPPCTPPCLAHSVTVPPPPHHAGAGLQATHLGASTRSSSSSLLGLFSVALTHQIGRALLPLRSSSPPPTPPQNNAWPRPHHGRRGPLPRRLVSALCWGRCQGTCDCACVPEGREGGVVRGEACFNDDLQVNKLSVAHVGP